MQKSQTPQSRYLLTHLSELQSVGIFSLKDNNVISYQKNSAHNPLHHCAELQCYLVENAEKQTVPYICKDDYQAYFVCIKAPDAYYLAGPMCTVFFNKIERHKFYRAYGIPEDAEKDVYKRQYQDIEVLTRTVIVELIREIRVHDKKNIEIIFDCNDCYQALLTQLPAMGVEVAADPDNNLQVKIKEVV